MKNKQLRYLEVYYLFCKFVLLSTIASALLIIYIQMEKDFFDIPQAVEISYSDVFYSDSTIISEENNISSSEEGDRIIEERFKAKELENYQYIYENYIYPLAKIIYAEGGNMNDEFQLLVGYVVINRVRSTYYPNTILDVFFDDNAYAEESIVKFNNEIVSDRAIKNAEIVIKNYFANSIPVSPALVFQAEFKQGITATNIGNSYFGYDQRILKDLENENF